MVEGLYPLKSKTKQKTCACIFCAKCNGMNLFFWYLIFCWLCGIFFFSQLFLVKMLACPGCSVSDGFIDKLSELNVIVDRELYFSVKEHFIFLFMSKWQGRLLNISLYVTDIDGNISQQTCCFTFTWMKLVSLGDIMLLVIMWKCYSKKWVRWNMQNESLTANKWSVVSFTFKVNTFVHLTFARGVNVHLGPPEKKNDNNIFLSLELQGFALLVQ